MEHGDSLDTVRGNPCVSHSGASATIAPPATVASHSPDSGTLGNLRVEFGVTLTGPLVLLSSPPRHTAQGGLRERVLVVSELCTGAPLSWRFAAAGYSRGPL